MEFLEIPLFDDDFFKMMFRFFINILFLTAIIRFIYYPSSKRKDYVFTYYLISIIVFFLCFTLKKYELDIGMALGLFAIFGIIRYRTDAIDIKQEESKSVVYENIENIKPENYQILKTDLENRTGLQINKITIGKVDFLKDTAELTIFYFSNNT